jgi:hypothetical protein
MSSSQAQTEPFFNRAAVNHQERELPHDDFRRAHYDYRGAHYDWRRFYYDFRTTFVSRVPVPSAFRNKTSGSSEEGDNAG